MKFTKLFRCAYCKNQHNIDKFNENILLKNWNFKNTTPASHYILWRNPGEEGKFFVSMRDDRGEGNL